MELSVRRNWKTSGLCLSPRPSNQGVKVDMSLVPYSRHTSNCAVLWAIVCSISSLRRGKMRSSPSKISSSLKRLMRRTREKRLSSSFFRYWMSMVLVLLEEFLWMDSYRILNQELSDLESVPVMLFDIVFDTKNPTDGSRSRFSKDVVPLFLAAAHFSSNSGGHNKNAMSFEDLRSWFTLVPSARKFLGNLLVPPHQGRPGWQVPQLSYGGNIDTNMILLKEEYAWHIGGSLSEQEQKEWKLLHHSSLHGLSFSTFLDGKTISMIKDKEGHVFGGYASQPWEKHGNFYGYMKSFIFQLHPKAAIFRPTGLSRNIQSGAVNFTSEDIPNGIGFGGRVNHFGLFISASFVQGQRVHNIRLPLPCWEQSGSA